MAFVRKKLRKCAEKTTSIKIWKKIHHLAFSPETPRKTPKNQLQVQMSQIKVSQSGNAHAIVSKKVGYIVNMDGLQKALEIRVKG
jgi:hypothetical protein